MGKWGIFATKFHAFGEPRDTIDTATAYNNLACCLAALDRPVEATWPELDEEKQFHLFHGVAELAGKKKIMVLPLLIQGRICPFSFRIKPQSLVYKDNSSKMTFLARMSSNPLPGRGV